MLMNKSFGVVVVGAAGVLLLAGCGGGSTSVSSPSATGSATSSGPGNRAGGFRQPVVSGVIASHTASTATVNSSTGQASTVTWSASTPIAQQQPATAASVRDGACVSARSQGAGFRGGARPSGASGFPTGSRPSRTRPSGTFTPPSKVTATAVTIEPATACGSSGSGVRGGGFGGFSGTVSKLTSTGFTLTVTVRDRAGSSSSSTTHSSRTVAVTTNSSTTYTREVKGSASSLQAGECMTAFGTESGGKLAARQITVSQSVNGTCESGFGGRGNASGTDNG